MDDRIRQLERRAAEGDGEAAQALQRHLLRSGAAARYDAELGAAEVRIRKRESAMASGAGVVDPAHWLDLVALAKATGKPTVARVPGHPGMINVHPGVEDNVGRTTRMLLRAAALCTMGFKVVVAHPVPKWANARITDMINSWCGMRAPLSVRTHPVDAEAKARKGGAALLLDHSLGELDPAQRALLWRNAPPAFRQRIHLDLQLKAGAPCSAPRCTNKGDSLCGMPLIDQGSGCGKIFCDEHLIGVGGGPCRCRPCHDKRWRRQARRVPRPFIQDLTEVDHNDPRNWD